MALTIRFACRGSGGHVHSVSPLPTNTLFSDRRFARLVPFSSMGTLTSSNRSSHGIGKVLGRIACAFRPLSTGQYFTCVTEQSVEECLESTVAERSWYSPV